MVLCRAGHGDKYEINYFRLVQGANQTHISKLTPKTLSFYVRITQVNFITSLQLTELALKQNYKSSVVQERIDTKWFRV